MRECSAILVLGPSSEALVRFSRRSAVHGLKNAGVIRLRRGFGEQADPSYRNDPCHGGEEELRCADRRRSRKIQLIISPSGVQQKETKITKSSRSITTFVSFVAFCKNLAAIS